jgi:hypothetical protein
MSIATHRFHRLAGWLEMMLRHGRDAHPLGARRVICGFVLLGVPCASAGAQRPGGGPRVGGVAAAPNASRRTPMPIVPVVRQPDVDSAPSCPRGARLLRLPAIAVVGLAAPVAGIAALVSEHRTRAAVGALAGGTAYATGVTLWLGARRDCHAGQALAYAATPLPAIAGAMIGAR